MRVLQIASEAVPFAKTGGLADVAGAHIFLGAAILLWSVALAMHAWAPNVNMLWWARLPPLRMTAFPALIQRPAASEVTLGRAS